MMLAKSEYEFHELANLFPLVEADLEPLAKDIKEHGQHDPITLYQGKILDGRNRYRACLQADVDPHFETYEGDDPFAYVLSLNLRRRHLSESQRAMAAARTANMPQGRPIGKSGSNAGFSQEDAAKLFGVSERLVRSARYILDHAILNLIADVDQGRLDVTNAAIAAKLDEDEQKDVAHAIKTEPKVNAVKKVIKQKARDQKEQAVAAKIKALPTKRYGIIYADPPWKFKTYSEDGMDRSAENHYPTSELCDIAAQDMFKLSSRDCILFLWATVPMLPQAIQVLTDWGFQYASHCVWEKDKEGTGYWFRNKHEILLVGTRGEVPAPAFGTQYPSVIKAAVREHSRKPDIFAQMIEKLFPRIPKVELNARGPARKGWDVWGPEVQEEDGDGEKERSAAAV